MKTKELNQLTVEELTGNYEKIVSSKNCISSAMNVGHPSNLSRVVALYGGVMDEQGGIHKAPDFIRMRDDMDAISITDQETESTIRNAYNEFELLLEPHGSVGWTGLRSYLKKHPDRDSEDLLCVSLETAHPAKFPEKIRELLDLDPPLPPSLEGIEEKEESYDHLDNNYQAFKDYLQKRYD